MSDHEEAAASSGYSTPVPELDDHRNQTASVQRPDRSRRGTFDSLYGGRVMAPGGASGEPRVRDFEEAVADEDGADRSPSMRRSRRPTVESVSDRSSSPPNSVKAFAEARRRERELSFSEPRPERKPEELELQRTASVVSRHSFRSRPHTVATADAASLATNKTAEEDVCFPVQDEQRGDHLHIDFDYLENFIKAENEARQAARRPSTLRVFPDLRPATTAADAPLPTMTLDGDYLGTPFGSESHTEKGEREDTEEQVKVFQPAPIDHSRVSFFSSAWESTIHAADLEGLILPGEDIRGLFTFPKGESDGVWWLNINKPSEEEVRAICRAFGVHPLTVEDVTTQESREKIELFPSYYFACFRSFFIEIDEETKEREFVPHNIYVVVFREGTLSFSYANNTHASHVRKRIAMLKDYVSLSSDWICYALIDDIVDSFAPVISKLEADTDQIEDEVFIARTDDMAQFLRKIGTARKNTMALMRLLGGKADVLKGFTKRCNENYKVTPRMDIGLYLGDIQDHVVTMMNNLGHFEKMMSRAHSNYLAQISIDGIAQGTNTNRVLSKITLLASIIVPLNVVTGLFGMNVLVPWRDVESLAPFFGILASLIAFCIICSILAYKLRMF
ncbi:cora-domain-containing protein [Parathielavia hyrcaniae]|uniref:Cora-domain-containing protein n=1 Tax=Parathielavia hyrcaniae TaxID=113614 RepID=A0AAN6QG60_9PEZI|nr:cora-domain-containing protein [Parathielavia hyrcaniae]